MTVYVIEQRRLREVNTDPQRRCYHGAHFRSEIRWSVWDDLEIGVPEEKVEERLKFWRELNDYAIQQRGEEARKEFRVTVTSLPPVPNEENSK